MKEYKLSAKSKYSVLYLLCGLFMFFFMFAIFSLSSFASSFNSSSVSVPVNESYSETYGIIDYNYNLEDYSLPVTTITTHSSGSGWSRSSSSNTCRGSNTIHLVTSEGDFVVNVSQGIADGSNTNHTVTVLGVPERVYSEFEVFNNTSSSKSVYAYTYVDSISVSDALGGVSGGGSFAEYSSYSPVVSLNNVDLSAFGLGIRSAGSPISYNFFKPDSLFYIGQNVDFLRSSFDSEYFFVIVSDRELTDANFRIHDFDNVTTTQYVFSDFTYHLIRPASNYCYYVHFVLPDGDNSTCSFYFECTSDSPFTCAVQLMQRKLTIADYMGYVKDNYDTINPSVINLNQNTAQSVSDISTAQSFETTAFDNFDTQFTQSGLDTFSMSFASTPLLWVSSIITTFYNNMPSTFQYLLMFVAFVGILCTVLNVFGRVAQRFGGGDNATKLNTKDVFSKIEKNGSI